MDLLSLLVGFITGCICCLFGTILGVVTTKSINKEDRS